jgi:Fe2+ or Zn2+ uptake regulation protein
MTCNSTTCLEHATIPAISLPAGFQGIEKIMIIQGYCPNCAQAGKA